MFGLVMEGNARGKDLRAVREVGGPEFENAREHPLMQEGRRGFAPAYTGTAVFLAGLKKGSFTRVAVTFCRTASTVTSICSFVPGAEWAVSTLASAIIFFKTGDHVVEVAFPTCRLPA